MKVRKVLNDLSSHSDIWDPFLKIYMDKKIYKVACNII